MIEFQLRGTPPSKNAMKGSHWGKDQKVRNEWSDKTQDALMVQVDRIDAPDPPTVMLVLCFFETRRKRDILNVADEGVHGIQDGIVEYGILGDDDYEHVKGDYVQHGFATNTSHTVVRLIHFGTWLDELGGVIQP